MPKLHAAKRCKAVVQYGTFANARPTVYTHALERGGCVLPQKLKSGSGHHHDVRVPGRE